MALFFWRMGIPSQENTIEICKFLSEYIDIDPKGDDFEGFKILYRLHNLNNGKDVFIAEADDTTKFLIIEHLL